MKQRFETVGEDFENDFVVKIDKANGTEMVDRRRIILHRNEGNIYVIEFFQ